MNIPKKIKIGGKVYKIEITKNLDLGNSNYSGEINYREQIIRVCPYAEDKMKVDFIHEVLHGIFEFLGYTEHDEKRIDELANALYMIIVDNPQLFERKKTV